MIKQHQNPHIPDYTAWGIITHLHNIGINPFDFDGNIIYSEDIINEYGAGLFIGSCTEDLEIFINDQKTSYDKLQIGMIVKLYVRNGVIEDSFPQTIYNVCKIEAYTDMNQ